MRLFKEVLRGISWGCTIMVLIGIIFVLFGQSPFVGENYIFQAVCAMIVGIGYSVPSIVYENEQLSLGMKFLIHMGTGSIIYFPIAYFAGWLPTQMGRGVMILCVIFMIAISFLVWLGFYLYYKRECKNINKAIASKNN